MSAIGTKQTLRRICLLSVAKRTSPIGWPLMTQSGRQSRWETRPSASTSRFRSCSRTTSSAPSRRSASRTLFQDDRPPYLAHHHGRHVGGDLGGLSRSSRSSAARISASPCPCCRICSTRRRTTSIAEAAASLISRLRFFFIIAPGPFERHRVGRSIGCSIRSFTSSTVKRLLPCTLTDWEGTARRCGAARLCRCFGRASASDLARKSFSIYAYQRVERSILKPQSAGRRTLLLQEFFLGGSYGR
jgi:hypothetical protein